MTSVAQNALDTSAPRQRCSIAFSSGAYLGSHSIVSHGRAASALVVALLVWIGPLSSTSTTGPSGTGWGLAWEDLRRVKPGLVMMSTCLQGQTGPHAEFPGYGQLMAALSGFYEISG